MMKAKQIVVIDNIKIRYDGIQEAFVDDELVPGCHQWTVLNGPVRGVTFYTPYTPRPSVIALRSALEEKIKEFSQS